MFSNNIKDNMTELVMKIKSFDETTYTYSYHPVSELTDTSKDVYIDKVILSPKHYRKDLIFNDSIPVMYIRRNDEVSESPIYIVNPSLNTTGIDKQITDVSKLVFLLYNKGLIEQYFSPLGRGNEVQILYDSSYKYIRIINYSTVYSYHIRFNLGFEKVVGFEKDIYTILPVQGNNKTEIVSEKDRIVNTFSFFFKILGGSNNHKLIIDDNKCINYSFSVGVDNNFEEIVEYKVDKNINYNHNEVFEMEIFNSIGEKIKFFKDQEIILRLEDNGN